jgi:SAM-dependent methyltransferase
MFLLGHFRTLNDRITVLHISPESMLKDRLAMMHEIEYATSQYDTNVPADYHLDLQDIKLPNDRFDLILCSHVLEHIPDDIVAMKELYRILKPGGLALFMVPMWPSGKHATYENAAVTDERDRIIHFGQFDHVRIYGMDIIDRLKSVGFAVEAIDMEERLSNEEITKYRIKNDSGVKELIFAGRK